MAETDKKEIGFVQRADALVRGLANGMTFGGADSIAGVWDTAGQAISNTVNGESPLDVTPLENMKHQREASLQAHIDAPTEYIGGLVVGGARFGLVRAVKATGTTIASNARTLKRWIFREEIVSDAEKSEIISDEVQRAERFSERMNSEPLSGESPEMAARMKIAMVKEKALNTLAISTAGAVAGALVSTGIDMFKSDNPVPNNTPCQDSGNGQKSDGCKR